eukprot:jgi/Undpi1/11524/HiC_scaffold_30.g13821.m1
MIYDGRKARAPIRFESKQPQEEVRSDELCMQHLTPPHGAVSTLAVKIAESRAKQQRRWALCDLRPAGDLGKEDDPAKIPPPGTVETFWDLWVFKSYLGLGGWLPSGNRSQIRAHWYEHGAFLTSSGEGRGAAAAEDGRNLLNSTQCAKLRAFISAKHEGGQQVFRRTVGEWIKQEFGIDMSNRAVGGLLHRQGL